MNEIKLYNDNCLNVLKSLPEKSVNMIFADPPYNLSGKEFMTIQSGKPVKCDKGEWDKIDNIQEFNKNWLVECKRVLSDTGTIWISGTLHNHPSIGITLKELDFWIINDIIWFKPNAAPLLRTNRFAPSTELIWLASKSKKYFFNYDLAKKLNNGKQQRNLIILNAERHKTSHPTEKPETLLEKLIIFGTKENDIILDPFLGSGTTGVVAKKLNRSFIGCEIDENFFKIANKRIENTRTDLELTKYYNSLTINTKQILKNDNEIQYSEDSAVLC